LSLAGLPVRFFMSPLRTLAALAVVLPVAAGALFGSTACPVDSAPPIIVEERADLRVDDVIAQRVISGIEATEGRIFIVVTVTLSNAGDSLVFVDPAQFTLENEDGTVVASAPIATAALADACSADVAAVAGRSVSCSVAFENDVGQIPAIVHYAGIAGATDTALVTPTVDGLQCLFFVPPSPATECYGTCVATNCDVEVNTFLGACEMCFPQCGAGEESCFCVRESCGPECAASSEDFDRCANDCVDACF